MKLQIPSFKKWISRYQTTIINVSVTVLLIVAVIIVLLGRFYISQRNTAEESVVNLAGMTANEVQSDYLTYFDVIRTISQIMKSYKTIEVERRRSFFNDIMHGILNSNSSLVSIYTIWKPHVLDGMDDDYINAEDSDETGQYITGFTRERGIIEQKAFTEYKFLLEDRTLSYSIGLSSAIINEPQQKTIGSKNAWIIDIQVPILQDSTAVGVVGATISLDQLQRLIESKNPFTEGRAMVVSKFGNVIAHYNPLLQGVDLPNSQIHDPQFAADIHEQVYQVILDSMIEMKPAVKKTKDTLMVSYSLKATNPRLATFALNETTNPPWAVITMVPLASIMAPINAMLRFSIIFVVGAVLIAGFVFFMTSRSLTQRARLLQQDLEHATTLQDNVKYGLFLMDQKYVIQGAYSKALEKILSVTDLRDRVFLDLLSSSIKVNELHGLADYFEMIFKRSFDEQMLENINPINDFTYISSETKETKNLRTSFKLAEWGRGRLYILGTLEDITAEKELEKQLQEAESQSAKEMQALFEVIQLNPHVLNDFIEDAEYEFDQINKLLKNKENYHPEVLVEMYQSIHAIKSNALILNLEDFSGKLHKLESSIKTLQEKRNTVTFDNFLELILELNEVMKEKDQLKSVIAKIENFRGQTGHDTVLENNQEQYVLMETLSRICQKAKTALGREVRLVEEGIDEIVLEHGPRRIIKEVLTQLVRNAVHHGVETVQEREAAGKEPEGEIRYSVRYADGKIVIKINDDGGGIDLNKIRQIALQKNLLKNPADADDKNTLLKVLFMPGFSTLTEADYHGGRGMGLSLVKDRIRELNGTINVSSTPGKGTLFTIIIPVELPGTEPAV